MENLRAASTLVLCLSYFSLHFQSAFATAVTAAVTDGKLQDYKIFYRMDSDSSQPSSQAASLATASHYLNASGLPFNYSNTLKVPFKLWQTLKTRKVPNAVRALQSSWKAHNPGLSMHMQDDSEADKFVRTAFGPEVHQMYRSFPLGVMRADFWRYAILYEHGGVYTDADTKCLKPIAQWLPPTDPAADGLPLESSYKALDWSSCAVVIGMENDHNFCQWTILSVAGHPLLRTAVDLIVNRSRAAPNGIISTGDVEFVHMHTGPSIWTDAVVAYLSSETSLMSSPSIRGREQNLTRPSRRETWNALNVFRAVYSDPKLFKEVHSLGVCLLGFKPFNGLYLENQFGSQKAHFDGKDKKDWEGYGSWLADRMKVRGAPNVWSRRRLRGSHAG